MARPAKVWWNNGKEAWYATIGGKKVRLADGRENKAEAERKWHEYKAREKAPVLRHHNPVKVIAELYLDYIEAGHQASYKSHRHYLQDLCALFPDLAVKDVTATLVARWLHHHRETWGQASRWSAVIATVNGLFLPFRRLRAVLPEPRLWGGVGTSRSSGIPIPPGSPPGDPTPPTPLLPCPQTSGAIA